ncbi:24700_t:CDS:1, partial [Racocetra persica]
KTFSKKIKIAIMNQPINQVIGGQPLTPQNVNIPVNASFDNLTAEQKYDILTKGANLFSSNAGEQEAENQAVQFPDVITSGSSF